MRSIELLRTNLKADYFTDSDVSALFGDGPSRYNRVSQMVRRQEIIRLKNGSYIFNGIYRRSKFSNFYIANMLFGPSYVSTESALSYYGLIPEGVQATSSVTVKRPKTYDTEVGRFLYQKIPVSAFILGVTKVGTIDRKEENFLIASKEKALLDKLYLSHHEDDYLNFCLESLRIEEEDLLSMSTRYFEIYSKGYNNVSFKKRVSSFTKALKGMRGK